MSLYPAKHCEITGVLAKVLGDACVLYCDDYATLPIGQMTLNRAACLPICVLFYIVLHWLDDFKPCCNVGTANYLGHHV